MSEDPGLAFDTEGFFEPVALAKQLDGCRQAVGIELLGDEYPAGIRIGLDRGLDGVL